MNPETENVNVQPQELQEEHFKPEEAVETQTPDETAAKLNEQINSMAQELIQKEEEKKQLTEKVKLAQAELINYRKRKDEETSSLLKFCNGDLILSLLTVVDNFERALILDDEAFKSYLDGFKLIYNQIIDILN